MYIKVKHILLVILVVIISVLSILLFNTINKIVGVEEELNNETIQTEEITRYNMRYTYPQMLKLLIEKNSDWSELPLSEGFKRKYNSKDGIFGEIKFDKVEMNPEFGGKYPFEDTAYFVITQGLKKTAYGYRYVFENDKLLEDVLFPDIYHLTDENGNEMDYRLTINKESYYSRLGNLAFGGEHEQSVAVTDNFHKKYPYFLDLFIHYSSLGANPIMFNGGNFEDRIAYFEVDSIFECVKREYEVKFKIDERGYLDDADVNLTSEQAYNTEQLLKASSQVFYKNSNWDCLKLTDNFKNKYKKEIGVFKDIDILNVTIPAVNSIKYNGYWLSGYECIDGNIMWLYEKYYYDNKGFLDDAEIIIINYNGTDPEKAKEIYLKEHND